MVNLVYNVFDKNLRSALLSQNELCSPIAANFVLHFFGLDFHFYVIFFNYWYRSLHNDVKKSAHPKIQFIQPHKEHH